MDEVPGAQELNNDVAPHEPRAAGHQDCAHWRALTSDSRLMWVSSRPISTTGPRPPDRGSSRTTLLLHRALIPKPNQVAIRVGEFRTITPENGLRRVGKSNTPGGHTPVRGLYVLDLEVQGESRWTGIVHLLDENRKVVLVLKRRGSALGELKLELHSQALDVPVAGPPPVADREREMVEFQHAFLRDDLADLVRTTRYQSQDFSALLAQGSELHGQRPPAASKPSAQHAHARFPARGLATAPSIGRRVGVILQHALWGRVCGRRLTQPVRLWHRPMRLGGPASGC